MYPKGGRDYVSKVIKFRKIFFSNFNVGWRTSIKNAFLPSGKVKL